MLVLLRSRTQVRVRLTEVCRWLFMLEKGYSAPLRLHNPCKYENKLDSIRRAKVAVSMFTMWNSAYQWRICSDLSYTLEYEGSF